MGTIYGNRVLATNTHAAVITPSDTVDLTTPTCGILVGLTAGPIKVTTVGGETIVLTNVAAGHFVPIAAKRVWSTGTTATTLIALY